jgi:hypothetical protein
VRVRLPPPGTTEAWLNSTRGSATGGDGTQRGEGQTDDYGRLADDFGAFVRYARRMPRFLRETLTREAARRRIEHQLGAREESFLAILDRAVYANPRSPYRPLLDAADVEFGDVVSLVRESGLEQALGRLYDAGVRVELDAFKGRAPIERPGVSIAPGHHAFDNPLLAKHLELATGGSRGPRRRLAIDLDHLEYEAIHQLLFCDAFDLWDRPFCLWHAIPPSSSGMNNALRQLRIGRPVSAWFTPYRAPRGLEPLKFALFTAYAVGAARLAGTQLASPKQCSPDQAGRVARWLADRKREGRPAWLDTQASLGVRTCAAANAEGLDVAGTFLRLASEPFTEAKAAVVADAGARAVCHYATSEMGRVAAACGDPTSFDDMHFLADKLAVIQRDRIVDAPGATVGALYYTTLMASSPKVMINVESDDYGQLEERACSCPFGQVGLTLHMRRIRSYEKLTSEGNHFLGSDLIELVEWILPSRFGGVPGDYQLVEEEVDGLPKVSVVVRPVLGHVDDRELVEAVLDHLRIEPRNRLMADVWRDSSTVRVVRREPYLTRAGKILPLHLASGGRS